MNAITSVAVEHAKRASRSGLHGVTNQLDQAANLSGVLHTVSHEAGAAGVHLSVRLDALARAIAVAVDAEIKHVENADLARRLVANAGAIARMHLEVLLALRAARTQGKAQ